MSDTKKTAAAAEAASLQEDMDAVMRKYDRESATRIWAGKPKIVISVVMALFSVYCIWSTLFSTAALEVRLTAFLGLIIIMGYLTYPVSKKHVHVNRLPWYDIVIMVIGAAAFFYYCFNYGTLIKTLTSAAKMTPFLIAVGVAGILTLAELCRRCVGVPILVVVGALLVYTFVSMLKGGQTFDQVLGRVIYTLFFGTSGVLSTPVQVCAKFIAVFCSRSTATSSAPRSWAMPPASPASSLISPMPLLAGPPAARPRSRSSRLHCAAWCPALPSATPSPRARSRSR
jgi:TRAP-type uncharacterized transport system fused permease subunit